MTIARFASGVVAAVLAAGAMPLASAPRGLPDRIELGRDANGQPCVATRGWGVGKGGIAFEAEQGFSITCRGVAAARVQGYVAVPAAGVADAPDAAACGGARPAQLARVGLVEARRCFDAQLRASAIDVRTARPEGVYHGAAVETALAPLEVLMRLLTVGGDAPDRDSRTAATIDVAALEPAPVVADAASEAAGGRFTAQAAIAQGLTLIHSGRRVEASRLVNDAISEFADAPPLVQVEMRLTAALADSNISQFEAAQGHFGVARTQLDSAPESDVKATLEIKNGVYLALDAINRQQWAEALAKLDARTSGRFPLTDPVVLAQVNQSADRADPSAAINVASSAQLDRLVIEAMANWARSLSHLGLGQIDASRAALNAAAGPVRALQSSNVQTGSIAWLRAGLERQRGRIEDRAGNIDTALAGYDCAILTMQNAVLPGSLNCLFAGPANRGGAIAASPTVIAETQLDRATIRARQPGVDQASLLADYDSAVETLTSGGGANGAAPLALAGYLDALVAASAQAPSAAIEERFFKAMQAAGEPAVAREVVRLQSVVAADNSVQALLADRSEVERNIVRLRYQIQSAPPGDAAALEPLVKERDAAQRTLDDINVKIAPTLSAVDEKPVTPDEVRALLKPGEVYLKLAALSNRLYVAAIGSDRTMIYRVAAPAREIDDDAGLVLRSARSSVSDTGVVSLRPFAVTKSHDLFVKLAGPAREMLTRASGITYDPVGELRNLPAAILVTAPEAADAADRRRKRDYSDVGFLGRTADLATALSPRSFVVTRTKTVVAAPKQFLGLGETAYAPVLGGDAGARPIQLAPGCRVAYADWATQFNGNLPISAREIVLSADALGVGRAPMMIGADFNDTNLQRASAAGELAQYQVLHFATHGLTAQPFPVAGCPTGLPPSLLTTLVPPDANGLGDSDGLLSFDEVAALRLNANLVFLSACETASGVSESAGRLTGQEDSTPSLDGLVRAFLAANTRTVVATLWSVPATPDTDALIADFYRTGRSASIASSLRTAQQGLVRKPDTSHPYFWAAYFVVGDGSKTMLGSSVFGGNTGQ